MIPILYENTETSFTNNGLGRLRDCISCEVTEERNGIYECDFQYPVDGANYDLIQCGRIIAVTHDDSGDVQPFDIVSYSKPINGIVTFHAVHVSYRLTGYVVVPSPGSVYSLTDAFAVIENDTTPNIIPFTFSSDFDSSGYLPIIDGTPRSVRQILGGSEGSILDTYGGEFSWKKFAVNILQNRGVHRDFTVRYGVNLLNYKDDTDYSATFSSCVPYWKGSNGFVIAPRVDLGVTAYNGRNVCAALDLTDKFDTEPTTVQLTNTAMTYMRSNQTVIPQQNISVDFVRLQDFDEYAGFSDLMQCRLCDTINVVFAKYGMQGSFKIVKTVWNVLTGKYTSMELGALSTTLSDALGISNSFGGGSSGGGGSTEISFIVPTAAAWTNTSSDWSPTETGIATARINPSNTSACYVQLIDTSNSNVIVCQIYTTNGGGATGCFPVIAGHTYKVNAKSTNISTFQVYNYVFDQ